MSRALRRHHTRRLKHNRKNYYDRELIGRDLGKVVSTPHPCSARCCGNQRKWEGETRQEQIARIREREMME